MKNILWIIVIIIVAAIAYFIFAAGDDVEVEVPAETRETSGVVTEIDMEGVALDGPSLLTIDTAEGEVTVAVPSMGINLCAAAGDIADVFSLEEGAEVSVRGTVDEEGRIVPCEDSTHYLRVISGPAATTSPATTTPATE